MPAKLNPAVIVAATLVTAAVAWNLALKPTEEPAPEKQSRVQQESPAPAPAERNTKTQPAVSAVSPTPTPLAHADTDTERQLAELFYEQHGSQRVLDYLLLLRRGKHKEAEAILWDLQHAPTERLTDSDYRFLTSSFQKYLDRPVSVPEGMAFFEVFARTGTNLDSASRLLAGLLNRLDSPVRLQNQVGSKLDQALARRILELSEKQKPFNEIERDHLETLRRVLRLHESGEAFKEDQPTEQ